MVVGGTGSIFVFHHNVSLQAKALVGGVDCAVTSTSCLKKAVVWSCGNQIYTIPRTNTQAPPLLAVRTEGNIRSMLCFSTAAAHTHTNDVTDHAEMIQSVVGLGVAGCLLGGSFGVSLWDTETLALSPIVNQLPLVPQQVETLVWGGDGMWDIIAGGMFIQAGYDNDDRRVLLNGIGRLDLVTWRALNTPVEPPSTMSNASSPQTTTEPIGCTLAAPPADAGSTANVSAVLALAPVVGHGIVVGGVFDSCGAALASPGVSFWSSVSRSFYPLNNGVKGNVHALIAHATSTAAASRTESAGGTLLSPLRIYAGGTFCVRGAAHICNLAEWRLREGFIRVGGGVKGHVHDLALLGAHLWLVGDISEGGVVTGVVGGSGLTVWSASERNWVQHGVAGIEHAHSLARCECGFGYELSSDGYGCVDVNECERSNTHTCSVNAHCLNSDGSYSCTCSAGYTGDGTVCKPVCTPGTYIDDDTCPVCSQNTYSDTHGSIVCTPCPLGTGTMFNQSVSINDCVNPAILGVPNANAPMTGSMWVTLVGVFFAPTQSLETRILASACEATVWESSTLVSIKVAHGTWQPYSQRYRLLMTIRSLSNTRTSTFTFNAPLPLGLDDAQVGNAPTTASVVVTLLGNEFSTHVRTTEARMGTTGAPMTRWNALTSVRLKSSAMDGSARAASVTLWAAPTPLGSVSKVFTADNPTTLWADISNVPTSGAVMVTVFGYSFAQKISGCVRFANTATGATSWLSDSVISGHIMGGTFLNHQLWVTTVELIGTVPTTVSYDAITTSGVVKTNVLITGATTVTLIGRGGSHVGYTNRGRISTNVQATTWRSATSIDSKVASRIATITCMLQSLGVLVGSVAGSISVDGHMPSSVIATNLPVTSSSSVTVVGTHHGRWTTTVHVAHSSAHMTRWHSDSSILALSAGGVLPACAVAVTSNGRVMSSLTVAMTLDGQAPTVSSVAATNQAHTSNRVVTVVGKGFAVFDISPRSRLGSVLAGATASSSSLWVSDCSITTKQSVGMSTLSTASVTLFAFPDAAGTVWNALSVDTVEVSTHSRINIAVTSTASVTVFGKSFASTFVSSHASVGGSSAKGTKWTGLTSISLRTATGSRFERVCAVTVVSNAGTSTLAFTFESTHVSGVVRTNGHATAATLVTVVGMQFGDTDVTSRATISTGTAMTVWISDTALVVRSTSSMGRSIGVASTLSMQMDGSLSVAVTTDGLVVSSVTNVNLPPSGSVSVTVIGSGMVRGDASINLGLGNTGSTMRSLWRSDSSMSSKVAWGLGTVRLVVATSSGSTSTLTASASYHAASPVIVVRPNSPTTSSVSVTVICVSIGKWDRSAGSAMGGSSVAGTLWMSTSGIRALPIDSTDVLAVGLPMIVSGSAMTGTMSAAISMDIRPISTSSLIQTNSPTTGSLTVTVTGRTFGTTMVSQRLVLGRSGSEFSKWFSESSLVGKIVNGDRSMSAIRVTFYQSFGSLSRAHTHDTAIASDIVSINQPTSGCATVTLVGGGLSHHHSSANVRQSKTSAEASAWISESAVTAKMPMGALKMYSFVVSVDARHGSVDDKFTFDHSVPSVSIAANSPATGCVTVSVYGSNIAVLGDPSGRIRTTGHTSMSSTRWLTDTGVHGLTPRGSNFAVPLSVSLSALAGTSVELFKHLLFSVKNSDFKAPPTVPLQGKAVVAEPQNGCTALTNAADISGNVAIIIRGTCSSQIKMQNAQDAGAIAVVVTKDGPGGASVMCCSDPAITTLGVMTLQKDGDFIRDRIISNPGVEIQFPLDPGTSSYIIGVVLRDNSTLTYDTRQVLPMPALGNVASTSGVSVTILSLHNSDNPMSARLLTGGTNAAKTIWKSETSLYSLPSNGLGIRRSSMVTMGARFDMQRAGTHSALLTFDAHRVSGATRLNGPVTGANSVTVLGHPALGASDYTMIAQIGHTVASLTSWRSASSILFKQSAGVGSMRAFVLTASSLRVDSLSRAFTQDYMPVHASSALSANDPVTSGVSITVVGRMMAHAQYTVRARMGNTWSGNTAAPSTLWTSESAVTSLRGDGAARTICAAISMAGDVQSHGTLTDIFTMDTGIPSALLVANTATSGATSITVLGRAFGASDFTPQLWTGWLGGTRSTATVWISESSLRCRQTPGITHSHRLGVSVGVRRATLTLAISYNGIEASSVHTTNRATSGAQGVTLLGVAVGKQPYSQRIRFGMSSGRRTKWISESCLSSKVSGGVSIQHRVTLTSGHLWATSTRLTTFDSSEISATVRSNVASSGSLSVTVIGAKAFESQATGCSRLSGTAFDATEWFSTSSVRGRSPSGVSQLHRLSLSIAYQYGISGSISEAFSYDKIRVSSSLHSNLAGTGATSVTIVGRTSLRSSDRTSRWVFGSTTVGASRWTSETSMIGKITSGIFTFQAVAISTEMQRVSSISQSTTYDSFIHLSDSIHHNSAATSGISVTIVGFALGPFEYTMRGRVGNTWSGDTASEKTLWTSATSVACHHSSAVARVVAFIASSGSDRQAYMTHTDVVTFDAVTPSAVLVGNGPTTGANSVTVLGHSVGGADYTVKSRFGATVQETTKWVCQSSIVSRGSAGVWANRRVALTAGVFTESQTFIFTWDVPICNVLVTNIPTTAAVSVTVIAEAFAHSDHTGMARLGETTTMASHWVSSSCICCKGSRGMEFHRRLGITAGEYYVRWSLTAAMTFGVAEVSSQSVVNVASTGVMSVTVIGTHFGSTEWTPSSRHEHTTAEATIWKSSTTVRSKHIGGIGSHRRLCSTKSLQLGSRTLSSVLTYNSPELSTLIRHNHVTTAAVQVTFLGSMFAHVQFSSRLRLTGTAPVRHSWTSESSIRFKNSHGVSIVRHVVGSVGLLWSGTLTSAVTYSSPMVSSNSKANMAATGSASVTIIGSGYGMSAYTGTIRLASAAASTEWGSDTSVHSKPAAGVGVRRHHGHTVGLRLGTLTSAITFAVLEGGTLLSSLIAVNVPSTGATIVTVIGDLIGGEDYTTTIRMAGSSSVQSDWASDSALLGKVPSGDAHNHPIVVTAAVAVGSQTVAVTYAHPHPSSILHTNSATTGAVSVSVVGIQAQMIFDATTIVSVAHSGMDSTKWISETSVCVKRSMGIRPIHRVIITTSLLRESASAIFTFDSIQASSPIRTNLPGTGGVLVTVIARALGAADFTTRMRLGGTTIERTIWASDSSVGSKTTGGIWPHRLAVISGSERIFLEDGAGKRFDTLSRAYTFNLLQIGLSSLVHSNSASTAHMSVTVLGYNMGGSPDYTVRMRIGNTWSGDSAAEMTLWVSQTTLNARHFGAIARTASIAVSSGSDRIAITTATDTITYDQASISSSIRTNGASSGAVSVTVLGLSSGDVNFSPTVALCSTLHDATNWVSETALRLRPPSSIRRERGYTISVAVYLNSQTTLFTIDGTLSSFLLTNMATTGGVSVTVVGKTHSHTDMTSRTRFMHTVAMSTDWVSDTCLKGRSSSGKTWLRRMGVTAGSPAQQWTLTQSFTYLEAEVSSTIHTNLPTTGAFSASIMGLNFGTDAITVMLGFSSSRCEQSRWVSESALKLRSVSGVGYVLAQTVTIANQQWRHTLSAASTFDTIEVSQAMRFNIHTTGSLSITVVGKVSGHADYTVHISKGGTSVESSRWHGSTTLTLRSVHGVGRQFVLTPTVALQYNDLHWKRTLTHAVTYGLAEISETVSCNSEVTGSTIVTIVGHHFGDQYTLSGRLGGTNTYRTLWVTDTAVTIKRSSGVTIHRRITTTVGQHETVLSLTMAFTYGVNDMSALIRENLPASGSVSVTTVGRYMSITDQTTRERLGATGTTVGYWISSTVTRIKVSHGAYIRRRLTLTIRVQHKTEGTLTNMFTYDDGINAVDARSNSVVTGSMSVTLLGLPAWGNTDYSPKARMGRSGQPKSAWRSQTCLTAKTPDGFRRDRTVGMTVEGLHLGVARITTLTLAYTYDVKEVGLSSVVAPNVPPSGATSVTVYGASFGRHKTMTTRARIGNTWSGDTAFESTFWIADSSLYTKYPPAVHRVTAFVVSSSSERDAVGSALDLITYDIAAQSSPTVTNTAVTGAISVTVLAAGTGHGDFSVMSNIGSTPLEATLWRSITAVRVKTATGLRAWRNCILTAGVFSESKTQIMTYDGAASAVVLANAPTSGSISVTVVGITFSHTDGSATTAFGESRDMATRWVAATSVVAKTNMGLSWLRRYRATAGGPKQNWSLTSSFTYGDSQVSSLVRVNGPPTGALTVSLIASHISEWDVTPMMRLVVTGCERTVWVSESSLKSKSSQGVDIKRCIVSTTFIQQHLKSQTLAHSHDASELSSIIHTNMIVSGHISVTVVGRKFGDFDRTSRLRIGSRFWGNTAASSSRWTSSSSVRFKSHPGMSRSMFIQVSSASLRMLEKESSTFITLSQAFSFDVSEPSSVRRVNSAVSGAHTVTVLGRALGYCAYTSQLPMGGTQGEAIGWDSDTAARVKIAAGVWTNRRVVVTVGDQHDHRTLTSAMTHDHSIVLDAILPTNALPTGATTTTIIGRNIGDSGYTASLRIGGSRPDALVWQSGSSVKVKVARGLDITLRVESTVAFPHFIFGTRTRIMTFDAPVMIQVDTRTNYPQSGASTVTMTGSKHTNVDMSQARRIEGTESESQVWRSDTSVMSKSPAGFRRDRRVSSTALRQVGSHSTAYSYDVVSISNQVSENLPTSAAVSVTLIGDDFSASDFSISHRLHRTQAESILWKSESSMQGKVSTGMRSNLAFSVTTDTAYTLSNAVTYDAAIGAVGLIESDSSSCPAGTVTDHGGADWNPTGTIGGVHCNINAFNAAGSLTVTPWDGTSAGGQLIVYAKIITVSGSISANGAGYKGGRALVTSSEEGHSGWSGQGPSGSSSSSGLTNPGVNGNNGGGGGAGVGQDSRSQAQVCGSSGGGGGHGTAGTDGTHVGLGVDFASTTAATTPATTPVGTTTAATTAATAAPTTVAQGGLGGLGGATYGDAELLSLYMGSGGGGGGSTTTPNRTPGAAGGDGGGAIALYGKNEITITGSGSITANGFSGVGGSCGDPASTSACWSLSGVGGGGSGGSILLSSPSISNSGTLTATGGNGGFNDGSACSGVGGAGGDGIIASRPPALEFLGIPAEKAGNSPSTGALSVSVFGANFRVELDFSDVAKIQRTSCASSSWRSDTALLCKPGQGWTRLLTAVATAGIQVGSFSNAITYDWPLLSSTIHFNSPVSAAASVTLIGRRASQWDSSSRAILGRTAIDAHTWASDSSVGCKTPLGEHSWARSAQTLTTVRQRGSSTLIYTWDFPHVSGQTPSNIAFTGATTITVIGSGTSHTMDTVRAHLGGTAGEAMDWTSESTIGTRSARGSHSKRVGLVTVALYASQYYRTLSRSMTYNSMYVSSTILSNSPFTGATTITIVGSSVTTTDMSWRSKVEETHSVSTTWHSSTMMLCKSARGLSNFAAIRVSGMATTPRGGEFTAYGLVNGDFATDINGWSIWTERGATGIRWESGQAVMNSDDHNGGIYQQFMTGGAGSSVTISGAWESSPTAVDGHWAEVLIINSARHPVNGADETPGGDVVLLFKNDRFSARPAWNGAFSSTAPLTNVNNFVAAGDVATIILKSGNPGGGADTGVKFDNIVMTTDAGAGLFVGGPDQVRTSMIAMTIDAPMIEGSATPSNTPSTGTKSVTIVGNNMGIDYTLKTRMSPGTAKHATLWTSQSSLYLRAPSGAAHSETVLITSLRVIFTTLGHVTYDLGIAFEPYAMTPRGNVPSTGAGSTVTIVGVGLHTTDKTVHLRHHGSSTEATHWTADTSLTAKTSWGQMVYPAIWVSYRLVEGPFGDMGTMTQILTYVSPRPSSHVVVNFAASGAISMTIVGQHMGDNDQSARCRFGVGTSFEASQFVSGSSLKLRIGSAIPLRFATLIVTAGGIVETSLTRAISFQFGYMSSVQNRNYPTSGSVSTTVLGRAYSEAYASAKGSISQTSAEAVLWTADTSVRMKVSGGFENSGYLRVRMTVGGYVSGNWYTATYNFPVSPSSLTPMNGPTATNAAITVVGSGGFGQEDPSPGMRIGVTAATITIWVSDSCMKGVTTKAVRPQANAVGVSTGIPRVWEHRVQTIVEAFSYNWVCPPVISPQVGSWELGQGITMTTPDPPLGTYTLHYTRTITTTTSTPTCLEPVVFDAFGHYEPYVATDYAGVWNLTGVGSHILKVFGTEPNQLSSDVVTSDESTFMLIRDIILFIDVPLEREVSTTSPAMTIDIHTPIFASEALTITITLTGEGSTGGTVATPNPVVFTQGQSTRTYTITTGTDVGILTQTYALTGTSAKFYSVPNPIEIIIFATITIDDITTPLHINDKSPAAKINLHAPVNPSGDLTVALLKTGFPITATSVETTQSDGSTIWTQVPFAPAASLISFRVWPGTNVGTLTISHGLTGASVPFFKQPADTVIIIRANILIQGTPVNVHTSATSAVMTLNLQHVVPTGTVVTIGTNDLSGDPASGSSSSPTSLTFTAGQQTKTFSTTAGILVGILTITHSIAGTAADYYLPPLTNTVMDVQATMQVDGTVATCHVSQTSAAMTVNLVSAVPPGLDFSVAITLTGSGGGGGAVASANPTVLTAGQTTKTFVVNGGVSAGECTITATNSGGSAANFYLNPVATTSFKMQSTLSFSQPANPLWSTEVDGSIPVSFNAAVPSGLMLQVNAITSNNLVCSTSPNIQASSGSTSVTFTLTAEAQTGGCQVTFQSLTGSAAPYFLQTGATANTNVNSHWSLGAGSSGQLIEDLTSAASITVTLLGAPNNNGQLILTPNLGGVSASVSPTSLVFNTNVFTASFTITASSTVGEITVSFSGSASSSGRYASVAPDTVSINVQCDLGKTGGVCGACPTGTYKDSLGAAGCSICPAGKANPGTQSTASTACVACPPHMYSDAGAASCTNCPTNTDTGGAGIGSCVNCPANQASTSGGGCGNCAPHYQSTSGSPCAACPDNTDGGGGSACVNCAPHYRSTGGNACVTCPANTDGGGGSTCTNCPANKESTGGSACANCGAHKTSTSGNSCVNCPPDTAGGGGSACSPCPDAAGCPVCTCPSTCGSNPNCPPATNPGGSACNTCQPCTCPP